MYGEGPRKARFTRDSETFARPLSRETDPRTCSECIESYVPARLDRMPWSRWHWLIVRALGATWILDGLEVTLAGSLAGILTQRETLGLTDAQVGASATFYLAGAVLGALFFGYGTDPRRQNCSSHFVYLIATALTPFPCSFATTPFPRLDRRRHRGDTPHHSATRRMLPTRFRGRVACLMAYWIGHAMGSAPHWCC